MHAPVHPAPRHERPPLTDNGPNRGRLGDAALNHEGEHPDDHRHGLVGEHHVAHIVAVARQEEVRGEGEADREEGNPHRAPTGARRIRQHELIAGRSGRKHAG